MSHRQWPSKHGPSGYGLCKLDMCTESELKWRESYREAAADFLVSEMHGGVLWCASGEQRIVVLYKDWGRWAARISESEWFSDSVSCGVL